LLCQWPSRYPWSHTLGSTRVKPPVIGASKNL